MLLLLVGLLILQQLVLRDLGLEEVLEVDHLVQMDERIQLLGHPVFKHEPVDRHDQVLREGEEVHPLSEDLLNVAPRAVHLHGLADFEDAEAFLEGRRVLRKLFSL